MRLTVESLVKRLKAQLGHPAVKIELTDDQIKMFIEDAVAEANPYMGEVFYVEGKGPQIDMREYDCVAVLRVYKKPFATYEGGEVDVFRTFTVSNAMNVSQEDVYRARAMVAQWEQIKSEDYKLIDGILYLYNFNDQVTVEYTKEVSLTNVTSTKWLQWIKAYALALCKEGLGRIRGKMKVSNIPVSNDGEAILAEGLQEQQQLKQQLVENGEGVFIIEVG